MTGFGRLSVVVGLALLGTGGLAQDRTVDVRFPPGTTGTTIADVVSGDETVIFLVGAEAGQRMDVVLSSDNLATYFNLYAPGTGPGDAALVIGEQASNDWSGVLPASGDYTISVFLFRNAARRGETSAFTLDVSVTGATGADVQGDYADGLGGGPDFLVVEGARILNLRASPSTGASVVARLGEGQRVRNLGCRMLEGRRWCHVATPADPGFEGWAAGEFLVE